MQRSWEEEAAGSGILIFHKNAVDSFGFAIIYQNNTSRSAHVTKPVSDLLSYHSGYAYDHTVVEVFLLDYQQKVS